MPIKCAQNIHNHSNQIESLPKFMAFLTERLKDTVSMLKADSFDLLSSSLSGLGRSLSNTMASSGVHLDLMEEISWWATMVPGIDPAPSFSYLNSEWGFSGIKASKPSGTVSTIRWWYDNLKMVYSLHVKLCILLDNLNGQVHWGMNQHRSYYSSFS